ncbi:MAG: potassium-transporting ATPase subunit KdpB, partial [Planctomycetota bacterium]
MKQEIRFLQPEIIHLALKQSWIKLNPQTLLKNPVMFTVEIGTGVMIVITLFSVSSPGVFFYNLALTLLLLLTVLFGNFSEAIAEAHGKAQASSLRKTREDTSAKRVKSDGTTETVRSSELLKGDIYLAEAGDVLPADGEIIEGLASIDESTITGESAPVIREAGSDHSGVIGGTRVLSDQIKVQVMANPGETFLDKMIALVEGANRQKTPNEIALSILLAGFTIVFLLVIVTLKMFSDYTQTSVTIAGLISLFVCLIPTTIGALLSTIGIAGMDRALKANVIAKSGKAVENAGDIDVVMLDKTGTITLGNRKATHFFPIQEVPATTFAKYCLLSSLADQTPEGKSIVELALKNDPSLTKSESSKAGAFIAFSAETRMSGIDLSEGTLIRKGAWDAIKRWVNKTSTEQQGIQQLLEQTEKHRDIQTQVDQIASNGGTPMVVAVNYKALGVIQLEDIIKIGIKERFKRLRQMGVKTVMVTGDNPLTAQYIANQAGVDDYIAEAKPEDKLKY